MGGKLFLTVFYPPNRGVLVRIVRRGFCRAICSFLARRAGLQFTARVVKTSQTVEAKRNDAVAYRFFLRPECETFVTFGAWGHEGIKNQG